MISNRDPRKGRFLKVFSRGTPLTRERARQAWWNANSRRIFSRMPVGWGYAINLYEVGRRLGLIRRSR
jgi:hypothetical protein